MLPLDVEPVELAEEIRSATTGCGRALRGRHHPPRGTALPDRRTAAPAERLGFDADEVELVSAPDGYRLHIRTRVAEPGHHRLACARLTGLDVQENQARRILNDIASFRSHLERKRASGCHDVAASRWLRRRVRQGDGLMPAELAAALAGRGFP